MAFILVLCVSTIAFYPAYAVSRDVIQRYFCSTPGNSMRSPVWRTQFQNQRIQWTGRVYKVENRAASQRTEILVKILPESILYDTVVVLEGPHRQVDPAIQRDVEITFTGRIFNGVDAFGVKEVFVLIQNPGTDIQLTRSAPAPELGPEPSPYVPAATAPISQPSSSSDEEEAPGLRQGVYGYQAPSPSHYTPQQQPTRLPPPAIIPSIPQPLDDQKLGIPH